MVREEPGAAHRRAGVRCIASGLYEYRPRHGDRGFMVQRVLLGATQRSAWRIRVCEASPSGVLMDVSGIIREVVMQAPLDDVINAALLMV